MSMETSSVIDAEPIVCFVATDSGVSCREIFEQSLKACKDAGLNPTTLSGEDLCIELVNKNEVYILDSFECDAYEYLLKRDARILGAPCVLHCLANSENLPERERPVYSMCMADASITLTGVPTAQRAELVKLIEWLGGVCTKSLIKSTTHLIAQEVSSKKYQAATGLGIPIVTQQWVSDSWQLSKARLFNAKEKSFLKKYQCPVFLGCVVTSSNVSDKEGIRQVIQEGGGTYTGQMTYKECTHLVIGKPEGQKYKFAQKWGSVNIVKPEWVYDCRNAGYKLAEDDPKYSVGKGASTPNKSNVPLPNLCDVSAICNSTISATHIDETASTMSRDRRSSDETTHTAETTKRRSSDLDSTKVMTDNVITCDILANFKVCLRGFNERAMSVLSTIVSSCGGVRTQSTVNAHYIVIADLDKDTLEHVKSLRQPVVSSEWLKQVAQTKSLVEVDPYLMYKPNKRKLSASTEDTLQSKRPAKVSESSQADQSMLDTEMEDGNPEQLLSQYGAGDASMNVPDDVTVTPSRHPPPTPAADLCVTPDVTSYRAATDVTPATTPLYVKQHQGDRADRLPLINLSFIVNELPSEDRGSARTMIETQGGVVVSSTEQVSMSMVYRLMPTVIHHGYEDSTNCKTVSRTWLDCVVTTTGLSAPERDAISELVAAAGGSYFEDLRKYTGDDQPGTTHLISETAESAKYKAAKNWGLCITTISWLTDSIKAAVIQPVEPYQPLKPGATKPSTPAADNERRTLANLQTPVHSRVQALRLTSTGSSTKKKPAERKQYLSTSILDQPDKSFHMNLDLGCFVTPEPKPKVQAREEVGTPLEEAVDKYLQIALDKHYIKTPDVGGQVKSENKALAGTVICLSKKLNSMSDHVSTLVSSLGGLYKDHYDPTATHLIYQGKATDADYRSAKRNSQYIVSPVWIDKCQEEGKRVSEALYPYNYKPVKIGTTSRRSTRTSQSHDSSDRLSDGEAEVMENGVTAGVTAAGVTTAGVTTAGVTTAGVTAAGVTVPAAEGDDTQTGLTDTLHVLRQIKSYMSKRLTVPKKQRNSTVVKPDLTLPSSTPLTATSSMATTSRRRDQYMDTQSQGGALVTWEDATSRFEQEILDNADASELDSEVLAQLEEDFTQDKKEGKPINSQDLSSDYTTNMETTMVDDLPTAARTPPPVFQFSGFSNEERDTLAEKLEMLGAQTILTSNFDPDCTHIILSKPQRNEKFLCALVKGLWLLDKSYIQACVDSNTLLPEEDFEWGNPRASHISCESSSLELYARAAHRYRVHVQGGVAPSPFSEWRVILVLAKDKMESMKRILEMGGADIISCSKLPNDISKATHAFLDIKKSGLSELPPMSYLLVDRVHVLVRSVPHTTEDIDSLKGSKVKCLKAEYIPTFLVNDSGFDESKYIFDQPSERSSMKENTVTSGKSSKRTTRS